jgi:hypothetical protein
VEAEADRGGLVMIGIRKQAEALEAKRLGGRAAKPGAVAAALADRKEYQAILERVYVEVVGRKPVFPESKQGDQTEQAIAYLEGEFKARGKVDPAALQKLGHDRAQAVQAALLAAAPTAPLAASAATPPAAAETLDPARVFVVAPKSAEKPTGASSSVRMQLSLL